MRAAGLLEELYRSPATLRLVLQPFSPAQTHAFLSAALGGGGPVSAELAHSLWEKTGGLPLYIEQACPAQGARALILPDL